MAMTIEELIHAEAGLARAFIGYLFAGPVGLAWPMIAASFGPEPSAGIVVATLGLLVVQIGLYVWFAIAAAPRPGRSAEPRRTTSSGSWPRRSWRWCRFRSSRRSSRCRP